MLKYTKGVGLLISADQLVTPHGHVICQMSDEMRDMAAEIKALNISLLWWQNLAFGDAHDTPEEPF